MMLPFPVETDQGAVWMTARDDLVWDNAYVVWCLPRRLGHLLKHTAEIWINPNPDQWSDRQRDMVQKAMTNTSREHPMPVGCLSVSYVERKIWPGFRNLLESLGIYSPTVISGFMDGMHRTAWLMATGAQLIPLMTTSLHECLALERHAGAGFASISLRDFMSAGGRSPGDHCCGSPQQA
ncbi:MAG: hypothetical protein ABSC06_38335 [Rhodopila sp.]|jgi:hypothetical protein